MRWLSLTLLMAATSFAADLDTKRSELVVKTTAAGIGKGFAHNHVIRATEYSGTLEYDAQKPEALRVSVTVKAASLDVDDPSVRQRYGEDKPMKESDRQKVKESMLSDKQLDAARFPAITFRSTGAKKEGDGLVVTGELTLHGVKKQVSVPVKLSEREGAVVGQARLRFRTSDFGIQPYKAALGTIQNSDEVELVLKLVANRPG